MTTSVGNNSVFKSFFEKQKFTGPNFIDWYRQLRLVFSTEDKENCLEHPIPAAPVAQPEQQVPPKALVAHAAWVKGQNEERQFVSSHVLKIKGYINNLERLSQPVGQNLAVSLILSYLNKDFDSFVQNYNMHGMGKTVNKLHAMLKLHEKTLPKKDANPALHAIRTPPPPKKDNPTKDAICHQCGEIRHWRRNCLVYLAELIKKKKLSQGASTSVHLREDSLRSSEQRKSQTLLDLQNDPRGACMGNADPLYGGMLLFGKGWGMYLPCGGGNMSRCKSIGYNYTVKKEVKEDRGGWPSSLLPKWAAKSRGGFNGIEELWGCFKSWITYVSTNRNTTLSKGMRCLISSGSPTTHSDSSLYASFIFDLSINQSPPADRSDFYEFTDELIPFISPPEYDCFLFKVEPNSRDFTKDVVEDISPTKEPQVLITLPTHPTLQLNLKFQPSSESFFTYAVWIFLPFLVYSVAPHYLLSLRIEDTIFDLDICHSYFSRPDISHQCGTVKKFNTHRSHLNKCPMMVHG
nr:hypothetical protein [Tanacetum cinerariifolium]